MQSEFRKKSIRKAAEGQFLNKILLSIQYQLITTFTLLLLFPVNKGGGGLVFWVNN
jgi:hypothetical protein